MLIRKVGTWECARVGDELVMMSIDKGRYVGLTDTAARVWELIDEPRDADEICAILCGEYAVSAKICRAEVDRFLAEMERQGAVAIDP